MHIADIALNVDSKLLPSEMGLFQFFSAQECEVILGWSFFPFTSSPAILSFNAFFTLDGQKTTKKKQDFPFSFQQLLTLHGGEAVL